MLVVVAAFSLSHLKTIPQRRRNPRALRWLSLGQMEDWTMLGLAITLLIIAVIAAALGFGGIAGAAAGIAKIVFFVFIVLFLLSLLFGGFRGGFGRRV
jgi:uncharacterized membrane protein YtjA (UPF0391 family)